MFGSKTFQAGEAPFRVTLTVHETDGHGLACVLTGGELPHVGGAVFAFPSPRLEGDGSTCNLWTACAPGHKDDFAARLVAKMLCEATEQTVSVSAGLHVDNAGEAGIRTLCDNCRLAAQQYLCSVSGEGGNS